VVEAMLACWLAISPMVFAVPVARRGVWLLDLAAAGAVLVLSLASFAPRLRRVHLGILLAGAVLCVSGRLAGSPPPAFAQNHIVTGLLLAMCALLPVRTNEPPDAWRERRATRRTPS